MAMANRPITITGLSARSPLPGRVRFRNLGPNEDLRAALARLRLIWPEPERRTHRRSRTAPPTHHRWAVRRPGVQRRRTC
jgi:hypothetical protein